MIRCDPADRHLRGAIRRRLLVNAVVDPDEAAQRLPAGIRPHVVDGGTVVGCCLLAIEQIRPTPVPAAFGVALRAAAHRISVEWNDGPDVIVGVHVPVRHTDVVAARLIGGRWFPGVHRAAHFEVSESGARHRWVVEPAADADRYGIVVDVAAACDDRSAAAEPVDGVCLRAEVGLSPARDGSIEAVDMRTDHREALPVDVLDLRSGFLAGFVSARRAPSYVVHDVAATWSASDRVPDEVSA